MWANKRNTKLSMTENYIIVLWFWLSNTDSCWKRQFLCVLKPDKKIIASQPPLNWRFIKIKVMTNSQSEKEIEKSSVSFSTRNIYIYIFYIRERIHERVGRLESIQGRFEEKCNNTHMWEECTLCRTNELARETTSTPMTMTLIASNTLKLSKWTRKLWPTLVAKAKKKTTAKK